MRCSRAFSASLRIGDRSCWGRRKYCEKMPCEIPLNSESGAGFWLTCAVPQHRLVIGVGVGGYRYRSTNQPATRFVSAANDQGPCPWVFGPAWDQVCNLSALHQCGATKGGFFNPRPQQCKPHQQPLNAPDIRPVASGRRRTAMQRSVPQKNIVAEVAAPSPWEAGGIAEPRWPL